jgi:hypothetical protein
LGVRPVSENEIALQVRLAICVKLTLSVELSTRTLVAVGALFVQLKVMPVLETAFAVRESGAAAGGVLKLSYS